MYYLNHSYCKYSYIDDQRKLCSDSCAFEDAHWAALGLADAVASTEEVNEHLAKETTTALDVVAVDSPGCCIQIITKLSSVVPGAIVRRARLVKPSAHQGTQYHDPGVVQVVTYGSIEQLNSARRLLEEKLPFITPNATIVPRSKVTGAIEPVKILKVKTFFFFFFGSA